MSGSKLSDEIKHPKPEAPDSPLGFTVHSMPAPTEALQADAARTRVGRWKMLFVLLICASPVIASYWTYYVIRPDGRRNYGELIEPQRPLPEWNTVSLSGELAPLAALKGQWLLLSVGHGACDSACQQRLYFQRQLRETLGKDKDRMDRIWLVTDSTPIDQALLPALKDATVIRVAQADLAAWLAPQAGQNLSDHLYVVDPMANWMMRFPAGISIETAPKVKRDLERLMRGSASWDNAGR